MGQIQPRMTGSMKEKVLLVISPLDFSDEIATTFQRLLEESGYKVVTASTMAGTARGAKGTTLPVEVVLKDIIPIEYPGAFLVGGPGFISYFSGYRVLRSKIMEMNEEGKLLAGVGESLLLLARVGLLKGRRVADPADKEVAAALRVAGAILNGEKIIVDGNILSASNDAPPRDLAGRFLACLLETSHAR